MRALAHHVAPLPHNYGRSLCRPTVNIAQAMNPAAPPTMRPSNKQTRYDKLRPPPSGGLMAVLPEARNFV